MTIGPESRLERLADIAELYYLERLTQQQIAERTGITRSTISRMITEASERGIVRFTIERPIEVDAVRAGALVDRFSPLEHATVLTTPSRSERLIATLGRGAAGAIDQYVSDGSVIGVTWGRSLGEMVSNVAVQPLRDVVVVQLAGAVAAESGSPAEVVQQLAAKLGAQVITLNSPYVVETKEMAASLRSDPTNHVAIDTGRQADIAVIGIGSNDERASSLVAGGHLSRRELRELGAAGAIGDAGGHPITADGSAVPGDFSLRLVGIDRRSLLDIPVRLAVAGGPEKVAAIRAAIRGGYVSHLVTDTATADALLEET